MFSLGVVGEGDGDFGGGGAISGGYIGGGPIGGGGKGTGASEGGAVGIGVDGDGNTVFWMAFGGLRFGSVVGGGESLMAPNCWYCSSGGNLVTRLGKSIASKTSRACSRAAASG